MDERHLNLQEHDQTDPTEEESESLRSPKDFKRKHFPRETIMSVMTDSCTKQH